jgi:hypothetical protein
MSMGTLVEEGLHKELRDARTLLAATQAQIKALEAERDQAREELQQVLELFDIIMCPANGHWTQKERDKYYPHTVYCGSCAATLVHGQHPEVPA